MQKMELAEEEGITLASCPAENILPQGIDIPTPLPFPKTIHLPAT